MTPPSVQGFLQRRRLPFPSLTVVASAAKQVAGPGHFRRDWQLSKKGWCSLCREAFPRAFYGIHRVKKDHVCCELVYLASVDSFPHRRWDAAAVLAPFAAAAAPAAAPRSPKPPFPIIPLTSIFAAHQAACLARRRELHVLLRRLVDCKLLVVAEGEMHRTHAYLMEVGRQSNLVLTRGLTPVILALFPHADVGQLSAIAQMVHSAYNLETAYDLLGFASLVRPMPTGGSSRNRQPRSGSGAPLPAPGRATASSENEKSPEEPDDVLSPLLPKSGAPPVSPSMLGGGASTSEQGRQGAKKRKKRKGADPTPPPGSYEAAVALGAAADDDATSGALMSRKESVVRSVLAQLRWMHEEEEEHPLGFEVPATEQRIGATACQWLLRELVYSRLCEYSLRTEPVFSRVDQKLLAAPTLIAKGAAVASVATAASQAIQRRGWLATPQYPARLLSVGASSLCGIDEAPATASFGVPRGTAERASAFSGAAGGGAAGSHAGCCPLDPNDGQIIAAWSPHRSGGVSVMASAAPGRFSSSAAAGGASGLSAPTAHSISFKRVTRRFEPVQFRKESQGRRKDGRRRAPAWAKTEAA